MNETQQTVSGLHRVWISEAERVVSFHAVEGYEPRVIRGQAEYVNFLQRMQEQGYRFQ